MGRTALILVVGMAVAFGFISNSMRNSTNLLTGSYVSYRQYSGAREMARMAVRHTLNRFDRNLPKQDSCTFVIGSGSTKASFGVDTSSNADSIWMTTRGHYGDSSYTMNIKLVKTVKPFFAPNAAMAIDATVNTLTASGHPSVDGHNWNITGTALTGSGDLPGITVSTPQDTNDVKGAVSSGLSLSGVPPFKNDNSTVDPAPFIAEYEASADYLATPSTIPPSPWGTVSPLNPKITIVDAGTDTAVSIDLAGSNSGCGILILRGNVKISGNFTFTGLVIVDGFSNIFNVTEAGTANIIGGFIISGHAVNVALKGTGSNGKIQYSSAALNAAKNLGKLKYYRIADWWE